MDEREAVWREADPMSRSAGGSRVLVLLSVLLAAFLTPAYAQFTYTSLEFPGADSTRIFGINDKHEIVGSYQSPPQNHAVLVAKGHFIPLAPTSLLGTNASTARAINNRGDVVGTYTDSQGTMHGFLLRKGIVTTIDYPSATSTAALGINDSGTIVGSFFDISGIQRGFVLRADVFTEIDMPGAVDTTPFSINSRGDIAGSWDNGNINTFGHGFVLTKAGQFISVDAPDAAPESTLVLGINDWGAIVGLYVDKQTQAGHGFLAIGSHFTTLDFPGAFLTVSWGINNADEVVGTYNKPGLHAGYLAVPKPD